MSQIVYVLTHEYSDHSAFRICGVTTDRAVADAWYLSNDETNVYHCNLDATVTRWDVGIDNWKKEGALHGNTNTSALNQ